MSELDVQVDQEEQGVDVVRLIGELDISTVGEMDSVIRQLEERSATLVIDLAKLEFLDSTGLRLIYEVDERARHSGRRVALIRGPESVHRVFRITRLETRLQFVASTEELLGNK